MFHLINQPKAKLSSRLTRLYVRGALFSLSGFGGGKEGLNMFNNLLLK